MTTVRQTAMAAAVALGTVGAFAMTPALAKTFVYVSSAADGVIDIYTLDAKTGALAPAGKAEAGKLVMPMAISPSQKHLYAVVRSEPFKVLTYAIDPATGALAAKATAPLPDSMPYVSTDATGRFLLTASYGGHKIAVNPIGADGLVTAAASQVIATGKNAHEIITDRTNKYVFATNLGSDQIVQYKLDAKTGTLTPNDPPAFKTRADHGPRHFRISPDNKYVYVLHELSGHVAQLALDPVKGTLREIDSVGSVPAESGLVPGTALAPLSPAAMAAPGANAPKPDEKPKIWAADIQLTPNGKFAYTTERTQSKIALFTVAPKTGKLTYVTNYQTEKQPRGIKVDPSGTFLLVAGEKSDRLGVFKIDPVKGTLSESGRYPVGNGANWIEIANFR
jgi:6-phosphogluconolactonase